MSLRDTSTERADQRELDRQRRETLSGDPLHAAVLREMRPKNCAGDGAAEVVFRGDVCATMQAGSTPARQLPIELSPADVIALEVIRG